MSSQLRVLQGIRVLSLALNLPGPAALMRCRRMGATCAKFEPPAGDPMGHYNPSAYQQMHEGVKAGPRLGRHSPLHGDELLLELAIQRLIIGHIRLLSLLAFQALCPGRACSVDIDDLSALLFGGIVVVMRHSSAPLVAGRIAPVRRV